MSRVACTAATGRHLELHEITGPALERYAARHGYEYLAVTTRLAPSRPAAWDKIALLHDLCASHEIVVWVDADAIVLDDTDDIAAELDDTCFLGLVEHELGDDRIPNTGVIALRGGETSLTFLDAVWREHRLVHHKWWDNAAILHLLGYRLSAPVAAVRRSRWDRHVHRLDRRWNSIPGDAAPDPAIMHFPGIPHAERLTHLERLAARV